MKNFLKVFALALIFVFVGSSNISAQSFKSTILGRVTDTTGANIPGATVTVTQLGTNSAQTVTTNGTGDYIIPQLPPGDYTLRVEAPNFKATVNEDITLETDQSARFDIALEAGNVQETVVVEDTAAIINTETSEKAEVITPRQVQDLPLNGRDFRDLALLVPGVYPRPNEDDQGQGVAASGSRTDATNFILDGTTNRSDRNGSVGVNTSVDSIREFKVATSSYSAEFGRVAGAQISVVSKSGTNRFSGTLFEYVRNDAFDAIDVFATPEDGKTLRRNQFGGTLGGPLPFFNFGENSSIASSGKDKTFFFLSYERTIQTRSESAQSIAPNAAWLLGDFRNVRGAGNDRILGNADDTNRVLCLQRNATNQFAATRIECPTPNVIPLAPVAGSPNLVTANPISLQMLARLPAANIPNTLTGYRATLNSRNNGNQFLIKIDRKLNEKNNFFLRFTQQDGDSFDPFPSARNFYPGFGRTGATKSYSFAASDTHLFTPKLVNEFRISYLNTYSETLGENANVDFVSQLGITGLPSATQEAFQGYPAIRIDGFSEFGDRPNDPFIPQFRSLQIFNTTTAIIGNQTYKFGVDILRPNYIEADIRNVRGDFRFRGRNTNPTGGVRSDFGSFADFLLGLPDSTQRQIGGEPANLSSFQYAFFVQNDWRIKPWLTLNLGVRYDLTAPLKERDNRLSNFLPDLGISVCASGEFRNPANNSLVCRSAAEVGLPDSLVRTDKNNIAPRVGFALRPFKDDKTVIRGGAGVFYSIETVNPARQQLAVSFPYVTRQLFSRNATNLLGLSFQNAFNGVGGLDGLNTPLGIPVNSRVPEVYQYNLTIERELARDLAFEVGYVGTQARFLGLRYDLNASVFNPDGSRTPPRFPTLGNIQYQVQAANSNYHGLQSSLRRRTRNGLSLLVSYTFSKSMDMNSNTNNSTTGVQRNPQNINDFRNEYALSDFHRTHQFSGSFNYDLPFGKGKPFFGDTRGISQILVGGWQLNGIVTHTSGRPFTPQFSAPDVTQQRPDLIGDPYQNIPEGFLFNPFAFAVPNIRDGDLYGNAGRNILTGPSYNRTDLSLFKVLRFGEKTRLQLRWEVFNVFNNPNYRLPTFLLPDNITEIRDANGVVTTPAFTIDELRTRTNVGRPTELATNMREMQFAVRLIF